ncbi:MAG: hypothetical protein LBS19_12780 [Clostridiales bacterium]|nr:hypothetical protein [Clostridiales bacterium]
MTSEEASFAGYRVLLDEDNERRFEAGMNDHAGKPQDANKAVETMGRYLNRAL